jgi:hypothetical protein
MEVDGAVVAWRSGGVGLAAEVGSVGVALEVRLRLYAADAYNNDRC